MKRKDCPDHEFESHPCHVYSTIGGILWNWCVELDATLHECRQCYAFIEDQGCMSCDDDFDEGFLGHTGWEMMDFRFDPNMTISQIKDTDEMPPWEQFQKLDITRSNWRKLLNIQ